MCWEGNGYAKPEGRKVPRTTGREASTWPAKTKLCRKYVQEQGGAGAEMTLDANRTPT